MIKSIKKQPAGRIIAIGFASLIFLGSLLLMLPCSVRQGITLKYIDALYTSASAVCVTGLVVVDTKDTFTPIGQFVIALLIQFGGLGVTTIGAGIMLAIGKKVNIKGRNIIKEALNAESGKGLVRLIYKIFVVTAIFEISGAVLSFFVFIKEMPFWSAVGTSLFHSIASFNNAGFDNLGNFQNLLAYHSNAYLNVVTAGLIFFGGIGFLVVYEMWIKKLHWKKLSMHSKVVISTSIFLIISGGCMLKFSENITWLGAFFTSVSARTAGFSTFNIGDFSKSGLMIIIILMFIGASPGSTGGGVKTSTFFVIIQGIRAAATNKHEKAFHYSIPKSTFRKAAIIVFLASGVVMVGTYLVGIFEPDLQFLDILFEMTSAFGTVGLSTGITTSIGTASKIVTILTMYIGRLGPLTIATLWHFTKGENLKYPDGNISVG